MFHHPKYWLLLVLVAAFAATTVGLWHWQHTEIPTHQSNPKQATTSKDLGQQFPVHNNITATLFWVGEPADSDNGGIDNIASTWDENWQQHYGGADDPDRRNGYYPAAFIPLQNPFYFALPYSDLDARGNRKASATNCFKINGDQNSTSSWCKNSWIAITHYGKTAYAQWQDAGPFGENDVNYVFGNAKPSNQQGAKAGLDLSPAVEDYLELHGLDTVSWQFVSAQDVPGGPWKQIITTN